MSLDMEDRHAAYCAGLSDGEARRVDLAIEDEVQARLHALTCQILGLARAEALHRHGPAWAALITDCGEGE